MLGSSVATGRQWSWPRRHFDLNVANITAGVTGGLWYVFGSTPIHLDATARLGLPPEIASSWFFAGWGTGALASILLTFRYRQPIALAWTIQGVVFLVATGGRYSPAEMAGAGLMAGAIMVVIGLAGVAHHMVRWLPLPIVMGMFAGSVLSYATGIFTNLGIDPWTVGAALLGYLGARMIGRPWLPPVGGGALLGLLGAIAAGGVHPEALRWSPPAIVFVTPVLSFGSLLTLSLPIVVMALGIGNVQALGILIHKGYRPPVTPITIVLGIISMVNAFFGGPPETVGRNCVAITSADEAGPKDQRYMANIIASLIEVGLALSVATAGALLHVLPGGLVATLAGLAILSTLVDSLQKALEKDLQMGAFFALAIAASPLTVLGIGSAFWALVGGILVSLLLERPALRQALRSEQPSAVSHQPSVSRG